MIKQSIDSASLKKNVTKKINDR